MTPRIKSSRWPRRLTFVLALLGALLAAAPLWGPGIVNTRGGGDSPFLLQRTVAMADNLRHGALPPRWMDHAAYDLGYPFFNHYAALPYYVSGGLMLLGVNVLSAIQSTQTLGFILAAVTMGLWAGEVFTKPSARLLAVAAYTFAPFHLVNVYVRGDSMSEFYAFVWYPLILWALHRIAEHPRPGRILMGALSYGALILTHNVSAMIFSPFAILYGLAMIMTRPPAPIEGDDAICHVESSRTRTDARSHWHALAAIGAALVGGIILTAWFWMPALLETKYAQLGPAFTEGYFHYSNHFRGVDLVQPKLAFDYSVARTVTSAGPFSMGLVQAALALLGSLTLAVGLLKAPGSGSSRTKRHGIVLLLELLLATVMITPISKPLWDHLPLLALTQFPWRFLSIQAFFAAIVTGAIAEPELWAHSVPPRTARRISGLCATAGIALLIASALWGLHPERLLIDEEDVSRENLLLYETFTGNIGTTIRHEYLPRDVVPRLYISEAVVDGEGSVIAEDAAQLHAERLRRGPTQQMWHVTLNTDRPVAVAFPLNWWPGWQATSDTESVDTYPIVGSGRLALDLPPGEHTVELRLRATPLQRGAAIISFAGATVLTLWTVLAQRRRPRLTPVAKGIMWALGALTLATLPSLVLQTPEDAPAVFFDFEQMPYPHQGPIDFGLARLEDVEVSAEVSRPGTTVDISLSWEALTQSPLTATLRLVSPAEPRHGIDYAVAEAAATVEPQTRVSIKLPADLSRGLYLLQLRLYAGRAELPPHTPNGRTMGTLYVGAIRVPQGPSLSDNAPEIAQFRDLTLHSVETSQTRLGELQVWMTWSTQGTPRNWRLSLRLIDAEGREIAARDDQPGYGYLPTTLWRSGEQVIDYRLLLLPEGLAPGTYTLRIVTYLLATMEGGGEADVPIRLEATTYHDIGPSCCEHVSPGPATICQAGEVALLGLDLPAKLEEGNNLRFRAEWNARGQPTEDIEATWSLTGPGGDIVGTTEKALAAGSPTTTWPPFAWIASPVEIALPPRLPEGSYDLALTLQGETSIVQCETVASMVVVPRPRTFTAPEMAHPTSATFGRTIELLGYAVEENQRGQTLVLTLWWRARKTPEVDYKRFVHLYDPSSEQIARQDDAMPRDWTYPTTLWVAGEVVSETIEFDVSEAAPGSYRIGVGWYDPETLDRLLVTPEDPGSVENDRLTLRATLRLPLR
ncbi:MAG: hypothetical protein ACP5HS_00670 [Anaerolineae bacterium]